MAKHSSDRAFVIIIASILAIGILIFAGFSLYNKLSAKPPKTLDELLLENYNKTPTDTNYIYGGYSFVKYNGIWYSQTQSGNTLYNLMFNFGPKEVENISITGKPDMRYFSGDKIYLTFDPTVEQIQLPWMAVANSDLSVALYKIFNITTLAGCTKEHRDCAKNGAVLVDCTSNQPVIMLNVSSEAKVEWLGNCIVINGNEQDIDRAATRWLYYLLGIVK